MSPTLPQELKSDPAPRTLGEAAASSQTELQATLERANELVRKGEHDTALELYCHLIERFPQSPDAFNNIAVLLKGQKQFSAAIGCLRRALTMQPNNAALFSNLGNILWLALEHEDAMAAFRRALALDPRRPEIHHNLGLLYFSLGDFPAAVGCFDRALALKPGTTLVLWDRALALLAAGDYARGFAAYEMRFDLTDPSMLFDPKLRHVPGMKLPMWQGEPLAGRTIYVYAEQGLGDSVQFVRFLPLLAERGARIILDCQRELIRLFASIPGIAELRPEGQPTPQADFHLPMMSLPFRLGITLANLAAHRPYITAPGGGPKLPRPGGTRLAAGIVWAGRPLHANDANRSMPLDQLLGLFDLPGLALYSLQKGARAADIAAIGARALVHDLGPAIQDFADTAHLIMQLDLVITVDTSVAHLAGALGRPCFVLLPFTADWRWMGRRDDSPWYPSLRLFRQAAVRDWRGVMRRVHDTLSAALGVAA
ncbi:MAG: tetratricopeptide repeat protein [Stellaceae bacterium]